MKTLNQFLEQGEPTQVDPKVKQAEKKENMLKKRVLMTKMRAVRGGATGIMASHEPDGELVEGVMKMIKSVTRKKKEKKAEKAMDAGARARRKLARQVHAKYVSGSEDNVPDDIRESDVHSGQGEKIQKRTKAWMDKKGQKGAPGLDAMKARTAEHKAKRGVKEDARLAMYQSGMTDASRVKGPVGKAVDKVKSTFKKKKRLDPLDRYRFQSGMTKEEVVDEAKVDTGRSDYGKASIRNYRRSGPGHGEPAMFDPENKRGKLIDKRREEHKARRGVKGAKVPAYKVEGYQRDPEQSKKDRTHSKQPDPSKDGFTGIGNMSIKDIMKMNAKMKKKKEMKEDKAFNFVLDKIRKEVGKDGYVSKDNPRKPQSGADKAKVRAHQAKVDKENAAARAKDPSQGRYPKG